MEMQRMSNSFSSSSYYVSLILMLFDLVHSCLADTVIVPLGLS